MFEKNVPLLPSPLVLIVFIYCFQYPEFKGFIFGEESNKFTNNNGQEIVMEVQEDIAATFRHLVSVIDGNEKAAQLLADIIHTEISLETNEARILRDKLDFELPLDELAIWIDPIGKMLFFLGSAFLDVGSSPN